MFFSGKFSHKNWVSPNYLKFGRGILVFIFPKFLIDAACLFPFGSLFFQFFFFQISLFFDHHNFRDNLVSKYELLQIDWNLVQGYITICLLYYYNTTLLYGYFDLTVYFFEIFPHHNFGGNLVLKSEVLQID